MSEAWSSADLDPPAEDEPPLDAYAVDPPAFDEVPDPEIVQDRKLAPQGEDTPIAGEYTPQEPAPSSPSAPSDEEANQEAPPLPATSYRGPSRIVPAGISEVQLERKCPCGSVVAYLDERRQPPSRFCAKCGRNLRSS